VAGRPLTYVPARPAPSPRPLRPRRLSRLSSSLRILHSFPTRRSSDLHLGARRQQLFDLVDQEVAGVVDRGPFDHGALALPEEMRSEEHTSELQSRFELVCRLLLEKKKNRT